MCCLKSFFTTSCVVWFAVSGVAFGQEMTTKPGWVLTFNDEFRGPELDRTKWHTKNHFGVIINNERQAYVDDVFRIRDGVLRIYALRQPGRYHGKVLPFRSGVITTKDRFHQRFGYFEIRCRVPQGRGYWPAFWTLLQDPDPDRKQPTEIDILEALGSTPQKVSFNNHYFNQAGNNQNNYGEFTGPDFTKDFHTFACDWNSDRIIWYVDGVQRHRATRGVPQQSMYLLVNLAVGGAFPNAVGAPPDESTPQQASYDIDYVRVYQLDSRMPRR